MNSNSALKRFVPRVFSRSNAPDAVERMVKTVKATHPKADIPMIMRAYEVAAKAHTGQLRKSGEPYITHPVAVAQILAYLGVSPVVVAAGLLHDTVEDTEYTLDKLRADFGEEIALLVDGVTKLDKLQHGNDAQTETVRKMIITMTKDIRVLVIKLADRLHNARTWGFMPIEKARAKAKETLEIYAPLAHRLGIQPLKTELEDLSFAVINPKLYEEIKNLVTLRNPGREEVTDKVIAAVEQELRSARIKGKVTGRPKEIYSIYQKMVVRGRDFDDIYDLVGIRVIVDTVADCYTVLGAVHSKWTPVPGRFKDYIATPKFNLYESLHTSVLGPGGRPVEVQVRTEEMHQRAEYGIAAHWKYKSRQSEGSRSKKELDMTWLSHINDWQQETADPQEFLDALRYEIGAKEVYAFTPKGKIIGLPAGATLVDFAYAVHTEIGHRTMGAKVNGRMVSLETVLKTGDVVQILTSKDPNAGPKQGWLDFVKSKRAQNKIRQHFTKERRADAAEHGKECIVREIRKRNLPIQRMIQLEALQQIALQLHFADIEKLYVAIGEGQISAKSVVEKTESLLEGDNVSDVSTVDFSIPPAKRNNTPAAADGTVIVEGVSDVLVKLAKCCTPVPSDEIGGYVTLGFGVSVHRTDCPNFIVLQQNAGRITSVSWSKTVSNSVFTVNIKIEALDRSRLLFDIANTLSEHHVNILNASLNTSNERVAKIRFTFEMANLTHLEQVLKAVRKVSGVYDVYRV
ncbi:bifunctional (p)ppGpp synthetase/guanosine-3',5'-bis(diphosphate) 3'-pyrophosphohydrolase [Canibacter sp. lx-72]|uniref:RelA/SpoT family protein n=1 Tax=Canibacter zhuwentaonis TaxID=2837491 RepID=UPI001BDCA1A7|nr:bifunctional (p)ppGpp synthetase/guanosine-3',5'-bis(diphosphate) 3'-pyrophosphohydrolase [Canibacter zhuwentaonis]MBT1017885.1 bifunctional (p)ppGpp synthetase/guanosine-3',5'-bis(diphosphate) 3'-pyrophosphohydrolase [Canibacter zhuwentaonis]